MRFVHNSDPKTVRGCPPQHRCIIAALARPLWGLCNRIELADSRPRQDAGPFHQISLVWMASFDDVLDAGLERQPDDAKRRIPGWERAQQDVQAVLNAWQLLKLLESRVLLNQVAITENHELPRAVSGYRSLRVSALQSVLMAEGP